MDKKDPFTATVLAPTATRPLLGLTILVIEDSRFACEALRLLCLRSGARIRRADCLRSAKRHLRVYRPSVVIADLGLPDGNGADLIRELVAGDPRVEVVLGMSGDSNGKETAMKAGADDFLAKPITSLSAFQQIILNNLPPDRQPTGLRELADETVSPDRMAFQDDMAHIAGVLHDAPDDGTILDYAAQFLTGVARSADDSKLENAASALAEARASGRTVESERAKLVVLVHQRLATKMAI